MRRLWEAVVRDSFTKRVTGGATVQHLEQQPCSFPTSGPSGFVTAVRQAPSEPAVLPLSRSYLLPALFPHDCSILVRRRERAPPVAERPHAPIWSSLRYRQEEGI